MALEGVKIGDKLVDVAHEPLRWFGCDPCEDILRHRVLSRPELTGERVSRSREGK